MKYNGVTTAAVSTAGMTSLSLPMDDIINILYPTLVHVYYAYNNLLHPYLLLVHVYYAYNNLLLIHTY